ncbi:MAG TPA: S9 family peptidase [Anaerolineae bacterium]|nr:S9 family peptidase [Anaerolineae bacterium]
MSKPQYPHTPTVDQVDDYHGTAVRDPFRWLEDTTSDETKAWIEAQNELSVGFLEAVPSRERIQQRLTELWDFPKQWAPARMGGRYFQLRNTGLQNQDVLFVMDSLGEDARVLLDPNALSEDGTVAMSVWSVSPDGQWLAYATSASGSDWMTWHVRDVNTGKDLPDLVEWSKFSDASWRKDSSGFYYSRYEKPDPGKDYLAQNFFQKVFFHRLGEPQSSDVLVYERPDEKEWGFAVEVGKDDKYLIYSVWQGTDVRNRIFYQELETDGPVIELIPDLEAAYNFIGNDGPVLYLHTNLDAPLGRLIAVDVTQPGKAHWRTIVPESTDAIQLVKRVHDEFIVLYLHDAHHQLKRFDRDGKPLGIIELPALGSIPTQGNFLNLTGESEHDELFYVFNSFLYPPSSYRYDFQRGESELLFTPPIQLDHEDFTTEQVFATSKDGTRIPMFLSYKKGLERDGYNPTYLYGYGGFNIPLVPRFIVSHLAFIEMGGVLAWANLRGGGEYGEAWHQAGMLDTKQNVFDDFIACAEYLIAEKITSTPRLAITGRSNGGLLVGACIVQRPDLFGATVPVVGVMDMLRFHEFTIGWAWTSDYGSSKDPEQFKTLIQYSPLHNIKPDVDYPATLVVTSDHDDRVVPGHSFKFAAALQAAQAGDEPILIRIQTKAGHGVGKPTALMIEEATDILAFLAETLEIE